MSRGNNKAFSWAQDGGEIILGFPASGRIEIVAKRRSLLSSGATLESHILDGDTEAFETLFPLMLKSLAVKILERQIRMTRNDPARRRELVENLAVMQSELQAEEAIAREVYIKRTGIDDHRIPSILGT